MTKRLKAKIINSILRDPKYRGKHVVAIGGEIFKTSSGKLASKIFDREIKKHPGETPVVTYIPKADALILWL